MPSTSGTFNFQSIQVELIIREAFERIGILGEFVEPQKLESAKRSINFIFLEWVSKSVNLWTLEYTYLPLVASQAQYILPNYTHDIIQVLLRTSTRQLNGTPQTNTDSTYDNMGGGNAMYAFDGSSYTACIQTAPNGNISYDYGVLTYNRILGGTPAASNGGAAANAFDGNPATFCNAGMNGNISYDYGVGVTQIINSVGITSETNTNYMLVVETSQDNINWTLLFTVPLTTFPVGVNVWFNIPAPISARAYRIRETGGADLQIQELYFNNNINNAEAISFVGIQSNTTTLYTLIVEYSQDTNVWNTLLTIPPQTFNVGVNAWFDIITPIAARAYRVRETDGATLNIQEIYFNNNTYDFQISNVSRYEYLTYPNKQLSSRPTVYYLDRQYANPVLFIWPAPSSLYNCLLYSYKKMIQDVGSYFTNSVQIPSRFYPALVWELSYQLALKYNPQIASQMRQEAQVSFKIAETEDSESVPLGIYGDYGGNRGGSYR